MSNSSQTTALEQASTQAPSGVPSITIVSVTESSISFEWTPISGATYYEIAYRPSTETSAIYKNVQGTSTTINGLTAGIDYVVNVRACNASGPGSFGQGVTVPTVVAPVRPARWEWWSMVSSDQPISLSASEWNAFCENINEVREYLALPPYSSGNFGNVQPGDQISAATVNHAVWAIGNMNPMASSYEVSSGDTITASFFNGLADALNSIS